MATSAPAPAAEKEEEKKTTLILKSADGKAFDVDEKLAVMSTLIKNMVDDSVVAAEEAVILSEVHSATLEMVIAFWENRAAAKEKGVDEMADGGGEYKAWREEFLGDVESDDRAFELIMAASYLDDKALLDVMVDHLFERIKDMSVDEVRDFFGIAGCYAPDDD